MIGHQALELLAGVLATLVRMVEERIRLASAPDGHDQRICDELGRHVGVHRPADDTAREQLDDGSYIEPALSRPW
ncbi:hypothetical protein FHS25_006877 [Rhizobium laguerreae]|uniref:Uncharacterized protein n=1 Tax=Rhizobium laguerreae TaxID=1076926 RepID=A0ABR6GJ90_9HYPH|nr:hypothetical protein [Rhizobium laguerreae]